MPLAHIAAGQVWVAETDGAIAGFTVVLPREDGDAELDGLFVEPGAWRSGIGRRLVAHAAGQARLQGARTLHVRGNPHAEDFYLACGFVACGTEPTRFGLALLMALQLEA